MKKRMIIATVIMLVIIGIGGIFFMNQQKKAQDERSENILAVKNTQEEVSKYIIKNYSGVEKIEWNGWSGGNSDTAGPFGLDTSMTINDYTDSKNKKVQFSYDALHPEWIEKNTQSSLKNKPILNEQIKLSSEGSPNAEIIYNLEENK